MTATPETASHYDRIGGAAAVTTAVDRLYQRLLTDQTLAHHFVGVDLPHLKRHMVYLLVKVLGGPDNYRGRDLKSAHAGLHITDTDYDLTGKHLVEVLTELDVPADIIADVAAVLAGARSQIVEPTSHSWLWRILHPQSPAQ